MTYIEKGKNNDLYVIRIIEKGEEEDIYINFIEKKEGIETETTVTSFKTDEKNINVIKTMIKVVIDGLPLIQYKATALPE